MTAEAEAAARDKQKRVIAERQRRLDKLGKGGVMDPRELFGLRRKSSVEKKKGMLDAFSTATVATNMLPNTTVEKTDKVAGGGGAMSIMDVKIGGGDGQGVD